MFLSGFRGWGAGTESLRHLIPRQGDKIEPLILIFIKKPLFSLFFIFILFLFLFLFLFFELASIFVKNRGGVFYDPYLMIFILSFYALIMHLFIYFNCIF